MVNNKQDINNFKGMVDAKRQHEVDREIAKLKDKHIKLEKKYRELLEDHTLLKNEYEFVNGIDLTEIQPIVVEPILDSQTSESYYALNISDVHCLETVFPEQVNELNQYNKEICSQSMRNLWDGALSKINSHRSKTAIPKIGINILGDIITNQLHPDQKETNQGTPMEEIMFALDVISGGIYYFLKDGNFEQIDINCCDGNHGRDDQKKIQVANRVKHSYEWLIYKFLEKMYKDEPRIKFNIATGYLTYIQIYDQQIRIHHGDGIRYQGGIGGLTIPMNKAIQEWNTGKQATLDVFGHWHTSINTGQFVSNGSVIGYSPYSIWIKAKYEKPSQTGILLNKKKGITSTDKIYVR